MKTLLSFLAVLVLAMAGGLYYQYLYPPSAAKRQVEAALKTFAAAVETQDRAKVGEALNGLIADDATIHLDVEILAVTQPTGQRPLSQDFSKAQFISFIDNILYTLTDYHYYPKLQQLEYRSGGQPMPLAFGSSARAEGSSYYAGVPVSMRFLTDATCTGQAVLGDAPKLAGMSCSVGLRMIPKGGPGQTLHDNDTVKKMLERGEQR